MKGVLLFGVLMTIVLVSGCTQLDEAFPKDTIYTLSNVPIDESADVSDCDSEFRARYPNVNTFNCEIDNIDAVSDTMDCSCVVHSGII